jgi:membrane fusion protein, heavy metal efflux system
MIRRIITFFPYIILIGLFSCSHSHSHDHPDDSQNHEHETFHIVAYSDEFEVFAEADPFIVGQESNLLCHFTHLSNFKPLENAEVTVILKTESQLIRQTLEKHIRKGIYSFDLIPETSGKAQIIFEIKHLNTVSMIIVPEMMIFMDHHEFHESATETNPSSVNTVTFTKEQSWKIDFAAELPVIGPFGQVIKTTARIASAQGDELLIPAKTNGIVKYLGENLLEGKPVVSGQALFNISGSGLADNNTSVRFIEARNNYERAKTDYERHKELAVDKIISEERLLIIKNEYENARAIYDNMSRNFSPSGQTISSPMNGFVKQVFVKNGQYVDAGQAIVSVSQNRTLILQADVQQKYAPLLGLVKSANFRTLHDNRVYTLEELNGKLVSYGRNTGTDNFMVPVNIQVNNTLSFFTGSFVEIFLKTVSDSQALTIPNSAIMEEQGSYFVYVQVHPELFEKRLVKPGSSDGIRTEILQGLGKFERIVSKGAILIKLAQASGVLDPHAGHVH